jgi:hypothetical protein
MKKLLLIPSLILSLGAFAQQYQGHWITKAAGWIPGSSGVREIYAVDTNVIWMIAYDGDPNTGGILRNDYSKSVDGGNTWTVGYTPANTGSFDWASLAAINADTAWAVSFNSVFKNSGLIWRTYNGGTTWDTIGTNIFTSTINSFPNNIYFWNANEGIILGDPDALNEYEIERTMDGGNTWTRVSGANIPDPQDATEAAWTTHFQVINDTIWFDTNEGRVYRSTDRGLHWQVGNSTLAVVPGSTPEQAIDIAFANGSFGLARYYDDAAISNTLVSTHDGGLTWDTVAYTGNLFGGDLAAIPGTNTFISTGISFTSNYAGTSYSSDGGLTWITIETGGHRGALAIADSIHMWAGGFSGDSTFGGVYKWELFPYVTCTDTTIDAGFATADHIDVCDGDPVVFTVTGFKGPEDGYYSGLSWVISSVDISGSTDPIPSTDIVTALHMGSTVNTLTFVNDGSLIGATFNYGLYYATPVFFGNATNNDPATEPTTFNDITLDPNCIHSGNSVAFTFYQPNDPACGVGIEELNKANVSMSTFMQDANTLEVKIKSELSGKAMIQIMDLTGRVVYNTTTSVLNGINSKSITVGNLATGTYIVKATVSGNEVTSKVVKL